MIRIAIVEDDQSADDQLTACLEKLSLQSKEVFDLSHYPDAQQFLFAFHSQFDLIFNAKHGRLVRSAQNA